jgi:hypothetical protein
MTFTGGADVLSEHRSGVGRPAEGSRMTSPSAVTPQTACYLIAVERGEHRHDAPRRRAVERDRRQRRDAVKPLAGDIGSTAGRRGFVRTGVCHLSFDTGGRSRASRTPIAAVQLL